MYPSSTREVTRSHWVELPLCANNIRAISKLVITLSPMHDFSIPQGPLYQGLPPCHTIKASLHTIPSRPPSILYHQGLPPYHPTKVSLIKASPTPSHQASLYTILSRPPSTPSHQGLPLHHPIKASLYTIPSRPPSTIVMHHPPEQDFM